MVAVAHDTPQILVARPQEGGVGGLPSGSFDPLSHRTLEIGLRAFVAEQTGLALGYVEQLYTFGDRGRNAEPGDEAPHVVSIGYLALTRIAPAQRRCRRTRGSGPGTPSSRGRTGATAAGHSRPRDPAGAEAWAATATRSAGRATGGALSRAQRVASCFGAARDGEAGTRRRCWSATSCSTKPACCRRPAATAAHGIAPRAARAWANA